MDRLSLDIVRRSLTVSKELIDRTLDDEALQQTIVTISNKWIASLQSGGKIMLCGNGGSAADAQHIAGELVSRFLFDRAPLAALALTVDTSILTAIGNDYGYDHVFSRQVRAAGRAGDVLVGISTSGRSPNVLAALREARDMDIVTVGFAGATGGDMNDLCDLIFRCPSTSTPLIQQMHISIGHIICEIVEQAICGNQGKSS
jgi:D-sedoheptulose 7-phosphate isomerase